MSVVRISPSPPHLAAGVAERLGREGGGDVVVVPALEVELVKAGVPPDQREVPPVQRGHLHSVHGEGLPQVLLTRSSSALDVRYTLFCSW